MLLIKKTNYRLYFKLFIHRFSKFGFSFYLIVPYLAILAQCYNDKYRNYTGNSRFTDKWS